MSASTSTSQGERRRKFRKRPLRLVYVELASGNGGMMRDLSEEGFAVRAMMPVRAEEQTPFAFSLGESMRIEGQGKILWTEENGRLAGVQFTEVSADAREQILEWLTRPDTPAGQEEDAEGRKRAPNPTLEQLREEMYTVPSRPEGTTPVAEAAGDAEAEIAHEEAEHQVTPAIKNTVVAPLENSPEAMYAAEAEHASETGFDEAAAPALPRLTLTPKLADPKFQPKPSAAPPVEEPSKSKPHWKPVPKAETPQNDGKTAEPQMGLPDISAILMQPPGQPRRAAPRIQEFASVNIDAIPRESWVDRRVSLSSVFTLMTMLALLAGLYVFHRNVGQGLIWLGEVLGGAQQTQTEAQAPAAVSPNAGTAGAPAVNAPAHPESSTQEISPSPSGGANGSAEKETGERNSGAPSTSPGAPLTALSETVPSPSPTTEAGQSEYAQAMQLLRARNVAAVTPEALRLLWIAVEKGNANAELELAQMYWRGRGVIQNCDQALILLTAAARKGSAEAQKRLLEFQKQGCE